LAIFTAIRIIASADSKEKGRRVGGGLQRSNKKAPAVNRGL
jgi:hypothetical protein